MTHLSDQLEGVYLAGEYGLQRWLGNDSFGAFFLTAYGPGQNQALLKVVPEDPSRSDQQLALWRRTGKLSHPNLLALLDSGRSDAAGEAVLYAVFEYPDDSVATAIEQGPLSEAEARDVLVAMVSALGYLHGQGLLHSSLDAKHVVAVGDKIKLASDSLRDAQGNAEAQSEEVRQLGALLYELLTTRRPDAGVLDLAGIGEPLASIIRHSLETDPAQRWSLDQIAAALNPEVRTMPVAAKLPPTAADTTPPSIRQRTPPTPVNIAAARPAPPPAFSSAESKPKRSPALPLLLAAVGAVIIAVGLAVTHKSVPDAPPPVLATTPAKPATAETTAPAAPTPSKKQAEPDVRPSPLAPRNTPRGAWRVVAYTYNRAIDAEKKARWINQKYPGFEAQVFTPKGANQGPYLVALGGHMTRAEAAEWRKRAVDKGLAHDTYIQNY